MNKRIKKKRELEGKVKCLETMLEDHPRACG